MGRKCIFEYKRRSAFGRVGDDDGDSIRVMSDGEILRCDYVFGRKTPKKKTTLDESKDLVKKIRIVLRKYAVELANIPDTLVNGSLDGSYHIFRFGDKVITSLNINRCDMEKVKSKNPWYYREYKENMLLENKVLDIYDEIASLINAADVGADLYIM